MLHPIIGSFRLWIQPIDATHSLNISTGVLYPKVFLGRSLNSLAIASSSSCEQPEMSMPLGRSCLSSPVVSCLEWVITR